MCELCWDNGVCSGSCCTSSVEWTHSTYDYPPFGSCGESKREMLCSECKTTGNLVRSSTNK